MGSEMCIRDRVLVAVHQRLAAGLDPAAALAESVPAATAGGAPVPLVCFG